jgi:hypothetical protein
MDDLISGFLDVVAALAVLRGKTDSELVLNKSYKTGFGNLWYGDRYGLGIANNVNLNISSPGSSRPDFLASTILSVMSPRCIIPLSLLSSNLFQTLHNPSS